MKDELSVALCCRNWFVWDEATRFD